LTRASRAPRQQPPPWWCTGGRPSSQLPPRRHLCGRHSLFAGYKARRRAPPEDFAADLANLRQLLAALRVPCAAAPGYEADDVLGALAARGSAAGMRVGSCAGPARRRAAPLLLPWLAYQGPLPEPAAAAPARCRSRC
jgi:hypothetical protein